MPEYNASSKSACLHSGAVLGPWTNFSCIQVSPKTIRVTTCYHPKTHISGALQFSNLRLRFIGKMLKIVTLLLTVYVSNCGCKDLYDYRDKMRGSSCDVFYTSDTSKNGTIMSPSYPEPYTSRTTCSYEFQGRGKERVQVVFQDFQLYQTKDHSKECDDQDSLIAFVNIDGKMEKIDSFCGSTLPKPVMSNGPRLKLEFHSLHGSRYSKGFKATYSFIENFGIKTGTQLSEYPCAFVYNSNESRSGIFYSPNYPGFYPRDTECYYFFHGNQGEKIRLHFYYFDIEGVMPCEAISASDYVEFSNYMSRDRKYIRHCGQLNEFDIESDRKFFRVTFRSNDRLDGTGFNASYKFVDQMDTFSSKSDLSNGGYVFKCTYLPLVFGILLLQSLILE